MFKLIELMSNSLIDLEIGANQDLLKKGLKCHKFNWKEIMNYKSKSQHKTYMMWVLLEELYLPIQYHPNLRMLYQSISKTLYIIRLSKKRLIVHLT
jgi:hypothetical protein